MKKILTLILIILLVIAIYIFSVDNKVYYLALGDEISNNNLVSNVTRYYKSKDIHEKTIKYTKENYRTVDLINDIEDNVKIDNEVSINNALIKADIITVSIGFNDFINYIDDYTSLKRNIFNLKNDMERLINILKDKTKERIVLIGIYNPYYNEPKINSILEELNNMYSNLASEYNIDYIDIFDYLKKEVYINNKRITNLGNEIVSQKLIKYIEDVII